MRRIRLGDSVRRLAVVVFAVLMLANAATPTTAAAAKTDVRLYFLVDGRLSATTRSIPTTPAIANATIAALFAGPLVNELAIGQRSSLPPELTTNGPVTLDSKTKTATVSLPSIFTSETVAVEAQRTAQIVYTVTQFSTITSVRFVIDGKSYKPVAGDGKRAAGAVGRTDFEALVPAILIETAAGRPLHVTGTANTFEAEFSYKLYDAANKKIADGTVMASSGSGSRGTFTADIAYSVKSAQTGTMVAFERSAKDGSTINLVAIPVALKSK